MKRLRKFFESIIFAGLRPAGTAAPETNLRWLGPLRAPVERFLAGGVAPSDPLYLTNRTFGQRMRVASLVAVPFVVIAAVLAVALSGLLTPKDKPIQQLTPAQIAEKMLPDLKKDMDIRTNHDLDVKDVHLEHGAISKLAGVVTNNTDHAIENAVVVFDLTNNFGSRLGAVSTTIAHVDAKGSSTFSVIIPQTDAQFAIVREMDVH